MEVIFTIRRTDANRALREIRANRGREGKDDLVHVLVSEHAVTFRAVGTESECPVHGIVLGTAQLPILVLEKAIDMRTTNELQLCITDGAIFCGKAAVRHPTVKVGTIPGNAGKEHAAVSIDIGTSPPV